MDHGVTERQQKISSLCEKGPRCCCNAHAAADVCLPNALIAAAASGERGGALVIFNLAMMRMQELAAAILNAHPPLTVISIHPVAFTKAADIYRR